MARTFTPTLFVGIGENYNFFTLRETYLHTSYIPGEGPSGNSVVNGVYQGTVQTEVRSFHHFNLSTNADEAWAKAVTHAAEMGLQLEGSRADLDVQMSEIRRASQEELDRRARAQAEREAEWAAMRAAKEAEDLRNLEVGVLSFTKHGQREGGVPFAELDKNFLGWVARNTSEFEAGSRMRRFSEVLGEKFADLLPREPHPTRYVGEVGKRATFDVEVLRVHTYSRPCFGAEWKSETVWIVTMITADGSCLVSKGTSFRAQAGEKLKIKATVKEHADYKGQAQTVVQRIAVLEETTA